MKKQRIASALLIIALLFLTSCNSKKNSDNSSGSSLGSLISKSDNGVDSSMNSNTSTEASTDSSSSFQNSSSRNINNQSSNSVSQQKTVTINISEYEEYGDDTTVLQEAIKSVALKSASSVIKGENTLYRLLLKNKTYKLSSTINLNSYKNIEIDGSGASLVWTKTVLGFYITDCNNVTFQNLSMDYDPLVFTQGIVTAINGNKVTVKIDDGYRADVAFLNNTSGNDGNIWSNIHDKTTGAVLEGTPHSYAYKNAVDKGSRAIELLRVFGEENDGRALSAGDKISLFHRGPGTIVINNSGNTKFTNVNIYSSPGFALNEGGGDGGMILKNVKIVPGPKPSGATADRVRSSNGDATHFGNVKKGPVFDGCTITHCGDDGINIQGFFFHVLQITGKKMIVSPKWSTPLSVGETIEGYKDDGYVSVGTAKIVSFTEKRDPSWTSKIVAAYQNYDKALGDNTLIYEITLDNALNLVSGDHITSLDRIGAGAVIKNSAFKYNRARGVVVKGINILIENNTFERNTHPAIVAHADILWCESGFPVNVVIRNNTITRSTISSNMILDGKVDQIGAILVNVAPPLNVTGFYQCMQNKNILIENNTINESQVYGIFAINCDGITIKNNKIIRPFLNGIGKVGQLYGITPKSGIFVGMSTNITVTGNKVTGGGMVSQAVEIHSTCKGSITESSNTLE